MKIKISQDELKVIKTKRQKIVGDFPDFLILGPQRTGTTWLTKHLRNHPEIFLSYPKELYFLSNIGTEKNFYQDRYKKTKFSIQPKDKLKYFLQIIYIKLITGNSNSKELEWYLSFFKDDFFYKVSSYFKKVRKTRVKGEATASTIIISEALIKDLVHINPNLKSIIIVRNPIERAWSHAKHDLLKTQQRNMKDVSDDEFIAHIKNKSQIERGLYSKNIQKWEKYLKKNRLYLDTFNNLSSNPKEFIENILKFLGVNQELSYLSAALDKKVNPTKPIKIPEKFRSILEDLFSEEIKVLKEQYNLNL